ncbi:MAG: DUF3365 domain-containing protein [Candidatus Marinimicrobia bacterium]|nr:DUF3365 domain-containing protein [Candidatus Neomarinimicrobiota bacterium]
MIETPKIFKISQQLKRITLILATIWTVVILLALGWSLLSEYDGTVEIAHIQANLSFEKDLVYRRWSANHGGTYVPVTEQTPPNPYLSHVKNRDVTTTTDQELTLVNPAYMTRQVHELGKEQYGHLGHITSLNPIRPKNAADDWETKALQSFEQGVTEVGELAKVGGTDYFRLMRPMITEAPCLKCHAHQGYKEGDLRGGISISIPMEPLWQIMFGHMGTITLGFGLVWLLGLSGIGLGTKHLSKRIREREMAGVELLKSEQRYKSLFTNMQNSFALHEMVFDQEGRPIDYIFLDVNNAFEKQTMLKSAEIIGEKVTAVLPGIEDDPGDWIGTYGAVVQTGDSISFESYSIPIGRWYSIVAYRPKEGQFATVFTDITDRKQAEEALLDSNQLKELLLDVITHDIKNPAGVIRNMAEMMLEEYSDNDMLEIIKYSSDKLLRVMDNATTLAQVTIGDKIKLAEIDITEVLHSVGQEFSSQLKQSEITFKIDMPDKLFIRANPIISEVFSNYISNAIKYADTGKKIIIDTEQNDNHLIINVKDFGETIEKDKYDCLFTRKYQIEKGKGRGLGLSIVKKIAEAHNAEVGIKPNEPTGNIFYIRIPEA